MKKIGKLVFVIVGILILTGCEINPSNSANQNNAEGNQNNTAEGNQNNTSKSATIKVESVSGDINNSENLEITNDAIDIEKGLYTATLTNKNSNKIDIKSIKLTFYDKDDMELVVLEDYMDGFIAGNTNETITFENESLKNVTKVKHEIEEKK